MIGGGIAGLVAARELTRTGLTVTVLEARDRLGGRMLQRPFAGTRARVELGGAWFSATDMKPLRRELERYGLKLRASEPPRAHRWLTGGKLRCAAPVPFSEGRALERALYELGRSARRLPESVALGGVTPADLDISAAEFIERLQLPSATRELLLAFASMYGGCDPHEESFLAHAADIAAFGNSAYALYDGLAEEFVDGTGELIARLAADSGAEIVLSSPVLGVEQRGNGVRLVTRSGNEYKAAAAVLAVPINTLAAIGLDPPAHPLIAAAASAGQPCRSMKLWILAEGVPAGLLAAGWGTPLQWLSAAGTFDGAQLLVGFGHDSARVDPSSVESVEEAVRAFVSDARVLAVDWYDWNGDEYSRGAWGMWRPGWSSGGTLRAFNDLHGRLAYASSDFAPYWPGWIAGAVSSGQRAAGLIATLVGSVTTSDGE